MQKYTIRQMGGSFGGIVDGINLNNLSNDDFRTLEQALWDHQVLVFRDQFLSPADQVAFGKRFGELHTHPAAAGVDGFPEILLLQNTGKSKTITEVWHSDVCCDERPPSISILQAIEVPPSGGDTMWADQYSVLDRISPALLKMLSPLRALHTAFEL